MAALRLANRKIGVLGLMLFIFFSTVAWPPTTLLWIMVGVSFYAGYRWHKHILNVKDPIG